MVAMMEEVTAWEDQEGVQYSLWNSSTKGGSEKVCPTSAVTEAIAKSKKPRHCVSMSSLSCCWVGLESGFRGQNSGVWARL